MAYLFGFLASRSIASYVASRDVPPFSLNKNLLLVTHRDHQTPRTLHCLRCPKSLPSPRTKRIRKLDCTEINRAKIGHSRLSSTRSLLKQVPISSLRNSSSLRKTRRDSSVIEWRSSYFICLEMDTLLRQLINQWLPTWTGPLIVLISCSTYPVFLCCTVVGLFDADSKFGANDSPVRMQLGALFNHGVVVE